MQVEHTTDCFVQLIRMDEQGKSVYLFGDDEIRDEMENHHIRKVSQPQQQYGKEVYKEIWKAEPDAVSGSEIAWANHCI